MPISHVVSLALVSGALFQGCAATGHANAENRSEQSPEITPRRPKAALNSAALQVGAQAPAVEMSLQDGFQFPLAALQGKLIAIYFCAADDDPECLREAQGLRDHWPELHEDHHVAMFGISTRDAASRRAYVAQNKIPFDLAQDANGDIARAFGVPTQGPFAPHTFLIGRDGKIQRTWQTADPDTQATEILAHAAQ
jgi:peroxiredoxin Q/BCP